VGPQGYDVRLLGLLLVHDASVQALPVSFARQMKEATCTNWVRSPTCMVLHK
jgi:hypothetical protein